MLNFSISICFAFGFHNPDLTLQSLSTSCPRRPADAPLSCHLSPFHFPPPFLSSSPPPALCLSLLQLLFLLCTSAWCTDTVSVHTTVFTSETRKTPTPSSESRSVGSTDHWWGGDLHHENTFSLCKATVCLIFSKHKILDVR